MKQETLEEVAEKYAKSISSIKPFFRENTKKTFIEGAKWQMERSYSEEDMRKAWTHGETRSPKEKAQELFDKYCQINGIEFVIDAKQCALIAVDEILNVIYRDMNYQNVYSFYLDVKKEIELL